MLGIPDNRPGAPDVINKISCSTHLSMKMIMLINMINVKMSE